MGHDFIEIQDVRLPGRLPGAGSSRFGKVRDEPLAPGKHVVLDDPPAEGGHALPAFLEREGEGLLNHAGCLLLVERVHQKGFAHLGGGAGQFAQHQHPIALIAGHILFRDQIHAVPQGGDPSHVGQRIQGDQLRAGNATAEINHRRPVRRAELAVDFADQLVHRAA